MTPITIPGQSQRRMTERQLMDAVIDCATLFGWRVYHTYDSRRSQPGFPDLMLLRGNRFIVAELKTERGTLRDAQQDWIDSFAEAGVECYVWRPVHWLSGEIEMALR